MAERLSAAICGQTTASARGLSSASLPSAKAVPSRQKFSSDRGDKPPLRAQPYSGQR
jgi:hypothetical protein